MIRSSGVRCDSVSRRPLPARAHPQTFRFAVSRRFAGIPTVRRGKEPFMATIEEHIDIKVPVRTAYNQWTQFEEFPRFMEGVEEIRQIDDTTMHWRAQVGGVERE